MQKIAALIKVTEFRLKLYPKNFQKIREFYEHFLCFTVIHEWNVDANDRGVMFNVGGTILELLTSTDPSPIQGADISLEVPDVLKLWETLHENATIVHALRDNDWGDTSFCIADPEGFEITFFTKK